MRLPPRSSPQCLPLPHPITTLTQPLMLPPVATLPPVDAASAGGSQSSPPPSQLPLSHHDALMACPRTTLSTMILLPARHFAIAMLLLLPPQIPDTLPSPCATVKIGQGPIKQADQPNLSMVIIRDHLYHHRPHHHCGCVDLTELVPIHSPNHLDGKVAKKLSKGNRKLPKIVKKLDLLEFTRNCRKLPNVCQIPPPKPN